MIKILLLLTVFLIPLMGAKMVFGFALGFEQIKVFTFLLLTTVSGLLWVLSRSEIQLSNTAKIALGFIVILGITSFVGLNPTLSFLGAEPYYQGWILYAYAFLFYLMVSKIQIKLKYWAIALTASSFLVSILAIKDWVISNLLHHTIPNYAGRVISTFGQPNFYSGFILLTLPFTYYLLTQAKSKFNFYLVSAGLLISVIGILTSHSRTSSLLLLFLGSVWLFSHLKRIWRPVLSLFLVALIASIILANQFASGIFWGEIFGLNLSNNPDLTRESVEKRPYIWIVAKELIKQKPVLGYGLENINKAYSQYFKINKHKIFEENLNISPVLISLKDLNIDRTHSYILDLLLFAGVGGLIGWSALIFLILKHIFISKKTLEKSILLGGVITYLIWIQFQNQSVVHLIYFWLILGLTEKTDIDIRVK